MIDVETEVYSYVKTALLTDYPSISMSSEHVNAPESFPHVSLVQTSNAVYRRMIDSSVTERFASIDIEVSVYTNLTSGRKAQAKAIASAIDDLMAGIGFTRTMLEPVPNIADATIYRIIARYRAAVDQNHIIYRR